MERSVSILNRGPVRTIRGPVGVGKKLTELHDEFIDYRFDQRGMYLRRRFAGLVAAEPAAGAASARYFQRHGEGGCGHDRYAVRPGPGIARWLSQEFVRRDEHGDHAKRRESHPPGSRFGGLWPGDQRRSRAVTPRR